MQPWDSERGFSLIETLAVVGLIGVAAAIVVPTSSRTASDLRLRGDARAIHNLVSLAKMRASARFTRERFYVDLPTETFFLQYWDKAAGAWVVEDGSSHLSTDVDFSFGTLSDPPPNTQDSIHQADPCKDASDEDIPDTSCVVFNSRGIPIDSDGAPVGNTAFYVTDQTGVYAVTLSATPLIRLWWSPYNQLAWVKK